MLIIIEKIRPPQPQLFNDHAASDAALVKWEYRQDHWVKYMMADLASVIRKLGERKPS